MDLSFLDKAVDPDQFASFVMDYQAGSPILFTNTINKLSKTKGLSFIWISSTSFLKCKQELKIQHFRASHSGKKHLKCIMLILFYVHYTHWNLNKCVSFHIFS